MVCKTKESIQFLSFESDNEHNLLCFITSNHLFYLLANLCYLCVYQNVNTEVWINGNINNQLKTDFNLIFS